MIPVGWLQGRKIYVLDVGVFADQHGMPACNPDTTFRVDPITNVPFLHDDPQVGQAFSTVTFSLQFAPHHTPD